MKKKKTTEQDNFEEFEPYGIDKFSKIPSWITITFVKFWAAAAAVFFIIIGGLDVGLDFTESNSSDIASQLSVSLAIVILIALFLALFMNYVVKILTRVLYSRRNNTYRFTIYNRTGFSAFLIYFAYNIMMSIILYFVVNYMGYWGLVFDPFGTTGGYGIEPFSYALYYIVIDAIFLLIKNLVIAIYNRVSYAKQIKDNRPILVES